MNQDEEALIASRLFPHEERPYAIVRKRAHILSDLLRKSSVAALPEAPNFKKLREEIEVDFEQFNAQIHRLQFTMMTNQKDVERYEQERERISEAGREARETIAEQRQALEEARLEKANRLEYDAIASDILNSRSLRPRDEQEVAIARLHAEIAELEEEKRNRQHVQQLRASNFTRVEQALRDMLRELQEDRDEAERREGMDEESGEEGEEVEGLTVKGSGVSVSGGDTPARTPIPRRDERKEDGKDEEKETENTSGVDVVITDAPPLEGGKDKDADKDADKDLEEGEEVVKTPLPTIEETDRMDTT